jgi:hypothetical protein
MTDYGKLAAAELAKVQQVNDEFRSRAAELRGRGGDADTRADEMEAMVTETSLRLAEDYIALAALERDVPPRSHADADEFAAAERRRET